MQYILPGHIDRSANTHLSEGIRAGDLIFGSGQLAVDEGFNLLAKGDVAGQARAIFDSIRRIVAEGGDPMNVFRDPAGNEYLGMNTERPERGTGAPVRSRQGAATKFSPILNARGVPGPSEAVLIRGEVPAGAR